jgi:hypothetical protein
MESKEHFAGAVGFEYKKHKVSSSQPDLCSQEKIMNFKN